jgi:hypothetical protein
MIIGGLQAYVSINKLDGNTNNTVPPSNSLVEFIFLNK